MEIVPECFINIRNTNAPEYRFLQISSPVLAAHMVETHNNLLRVQATQRDAAEHPSVSTLLVHQVLQSYAHDLPREMVKEANRL